MSERRQIIAALEIEGYEEAIASRSGFPLSDLDWATSIQNGIMEAMFPQSFNADILTRAVTSGGATILVREAHELLKVTQAVTTTIKDDVLATDTTITVDDTTFFSSSGTIFVGTEAIPYSGKTATTFTGCTRSGPGKLGTIAREFEYVGIGDEVEVTQEPDGCINRRCQIKWYSETTKEVFASVSGWVLSVMYDGDSIAIDIIGLPSLLALPIIGKGPYGRGILLGGVNPDLNITEKLSDNNGAYLLSDDELPLLSETYSNAIKIADEIIEYGEIVNPAITTRVYQSPYTTTYNGNGFTVRKDTGLRAGMPISYIDAVLGTEVSTTIALVEPHPSISTLVIISQENGGIYPVSLATVETKGLSYIAPLFRGRSGTSVSEHSGGDEFGEVAILRGGFPQLALQMLLSGNSEGGFDTLGKGLGAELPTSVIDIDSINYLPSFFVEYPLSEPITPDSVLRQLSILTGAYISPSRGGKLTAVVPDFYPARETPRSLTNLSLADNTAPNWEVTRDKIINAVSVASPTRQVAVASTSSFDRYGQQSQEIGSILIPSQIPVSLLSRLWINVLEGKKPRLSLTLVVREQLDWIPQVGEIIMVSMPHIPDLAGSNTITDAFFVLVGVVSSGDGASRSLELLSVGNYEDFGYVAPSLLVESISGLNVTVATTEFSPPSAPVGNWTNLSGNGGTQDSDWFLVGDPVEFVDESTAGTTTTLATSTITAINTGTSVISFAAVPAWLAAGDIIRLADYPATLLGPHPDLRIDWYCPAAPITGLDPKQYGV